MEKEIREKILHIMQKQNISYGELSKRTNLSKSTLQRYITKEDARVPIDRLELIAKGLSTTPMYLMGWEENSDVLTEDEDANIKYLKEHGKDKLLELYKRTKDDGSLLLLTDSNAKLTPKEVAQILEIIDEL